MKLLENNESDHTDDDVEHMKKVNGYVKRHLGQGPKRDPEDSKWRYSLTNLYNDHKKLDASAFAAYGWPQDITVGPRRPLPHSTSLGE